MVSFADSPFKIAALLPPSRVLDTLVLALGIMKFFCIQSVQNSEWRNEELCWYFPPEIAFETALRDDL